MANFSIEWLSKSYYEEITLQERDAALHSKVHSEMGEFAKESRSQHSPTSPNNSCGYTSGSESEVGDDSEGETAQQRRMRTKFTSEQITKLESTFNKHKYLGATQRRKIAEKLNLSETQVKTWFQNRRMKLKREVQDMRPEFLAVPAALLPPVLIQHPFLSGQLPAGGGFYPQLQPLHRTILPATPLHQHRSHPTILPPPRFY
ncbi:homeobox protein MSX-2-like [Mugil cephalus]|uniref:homeobox protein MSX-2-like n=1 Tax=Mugil cephalus TaxID=48193 RepID=UPI001FB644D8|nr:homeobox protein MSX-2-like [Mugil cephalus]